MNGNTQATALPLAGHAHASAESEFAVCQEVKDHITTMLKNTEASPPASPPALREATNHKPR